jgi:hypothetical protein
MRFHKNLIPLKFIYGEKATKFEKENYLVSTLPLINILAVRMEYSIDYMKISG